MRAQFPEDLTIEEVADIFGVDEKNIYDFEYVKSYNFKQVGMSRTLLQEGCLHCTLLRGVKLDDGRYGCTRELEKKMWFPIPWEVN